MLSFSADFHEGGFGVGKCVSQLLSGYAPHLESLFLEMTRNDHKVVGRIGSNDGQRLQQLRREKLAVLLRRYLYTWECS